MCVISINQYCKCSYFPILMSVEPTFLKILGCDSCYYGGSCFLLSWIMIPTQGLNIDTAWCAQHDCSTILPSDSQGNSMASTRKVSFPLFFRCGNQGSESWNHFPVSSHESVVELWSGLGFPTLNPVFFFFFKSCHTWVISSFRLQDHLFKFSNTYG